MDREQVLIDAFAEMVKIISGIQDSLTIIDKRIDLLKGRVKKLEAK